MFPSEWEKYRNRSADWVLTSLLEEEIEALDRRRGETGSLAVKKRRTLYSALYLGAMVLCGLGGWMCAVILGMVSTLIYLLVMHNTRDLRLRMLTEVAKAHPDLELAQLVEQDGYVIEEGKPLMARKWISAAVVAVSMGVSILLSATGLPELLTSWGPGETQPVSVQETEEANLAPQAEYTWELGESGYVLVDFDAGTQEVNPTIPVEIDGFPVVAIGERAFQNETRVTEVTLPDSITTIGSYAFKGCKNLKSVTLGNGVTAIGGEAFYGCESLTAFTVPLGVTEIRGNTFQDCTALTEVTLHDGLTAIHAYAFNNCRSLEQITLPSGITEIRANTFENCVSLTAIEIPEGVTRIAAHAFRNCSALAEVSVPATVKEIGSSAFRNCDALTQIAIPSGCQVNERAFKDSPTEITRY